MATDVERLVVTLEANVNKFTRAMDRAQSDSSRATKRIDDDFERLNGRLKSQLDGLASAATSGVSKINVALAAIGVGLSLKGFQDAADTYKKILNTLRAGGVGEGDLKGTFDQLFAVAQRNSAPIEGLAQLFGRVSASQKELGVSTQQIIGLTERVGQALRINGTSAEQASGALLQLAQTLGGGKVQAEEYNSLIDGLRPLLGAAAAGLTEAGGSVAKLTQLVKDGQVSSKAFFAAIEAGAPVLDQQLATAQDTVGQATTRMKNEFIKAVDRFDELTGLSGTLARAMGGLSGSFLGAAEGAARLYTDVDRLIGIIGKYVSAKGALSGNVSLGASGEFSGIPVPEADLSATEEQQKRYLETAKRINAEREVALELDRETRRATGRLIANTTPNPDKFIGPTVAQGRKITPRSLKEFPVEGDKKGGGGGGGGGADQNNFEKQLANLEKRRIALENEALTIGRGTFEVEKSRAAFELERSAKEAGLTVTDALRVKIDEAATAYANAKVRVDELTKSQQASKELQQFLGSSLTGFLSDVVSGGENASKAMMNLAKRIAEAALQAAILGEGPLASIFGTKGTGGLIGSIFGAFTGSATGAPLNITPGRASGGPVSKGRAYMTGENGRELFVPNMGGRIISAGDTARMGRGNAGGAGALAITINAPNSTPDSVEILKRQIPGIVMQTVRDAQRRGAY